MITKLGMVILLEHDLEKAVEFYKKIGLKQIFHIKESWAEFAIGSVKLGLCPTSQKTTDRITGVVLEVVTTDTPNQLILTKVTGTFNDSDDLQVR